MATVTLTYPDEHRDRIIEAVCTRFGYQSMVEVDGEDVPNPQTEEQFVAGKLADWVRTQVSRHETDKAVAAAEQAIMDEVDAIEVVVG